jgi:hypothetical protein
VVGHLTIGASQTGTQLNIVEAASAI